MKMMIPRLVFSTLAACLASRAVAADAIPPVQVLVPGFTVRELPVRLRNLNNLVYAPDGRLFALGYDGNVHQLRDTDGDGLEDSSTLFWDNKGSEIPASIGMAWGPGGLYIASRGKILHLRDKGDGTAELQTVTSGWQAPTIAAGSNLDAVGLAVDAKGNIWFGLGADAWRSAYRVDPKTGISDYNVASERGTIIRLSPDWKRRDIIATGLRFPVSLAFNAAGDLFCSDQEGATWLPNGNPFDELLHIQPGRHYGFPPRHPRHLPGVIDEPSVFDYGPQHQSTCGVHFNEPVAGGTAIFGPAWWRGDVFVAGESRGKIWRTKLVKSAAGYVAKNDLIAGINLLVLDAVPTPAGDLLVCGHTGKPDWGTGPQGIGKLYKLTYTGRSAPQPVLAYAASPTETRVIFDRALDPAQWRTLAKQSAITQGRHVAAGDRFESFAPGYQVVKDQRTVARSEVPVLSAVLAPDLRSLTLRTAPRTAATNYAVKLPEGPAAERARDAARGELPQQAAIDLLTDLTGVAAEWRDAAGAVQWRGWLPHLDLKVARELTAASEEHARLFALLQTPGQLALRAQLDLHLMLRPAIQPGAKLDFEYPVETVTVTLRTAGADGLRLNTSPAGRIAAGGAGEMRVTAEAKEHGWLPLDISLATGGATAPQLDVAWHTAEDHRSRALPLRRVLLPWAQPETAAPVATERRIPEIAGGDWQRGRAVFASAQAACAVCHQVRGEGGIVGPDLSNLVHRDYASVLQDIVEPSAAINPDRIAYVVELKDGTAAAGVVLDESPDAIVLADATGAKRTIPRPAIASLKASALSLMPPGLWQNLSTQEQRDLMTFLLIEPPGKN
ncbi:MAG: c-type cytochrome [Opitutaceae bacterium]|nr:c-type cytochrome [Opitutaceae bacterium]